MPNIMAAAFSGPARHMAKYNLFGSFYFYFFNVFFLQRICRIHVTAVVRKSTPTTLGWVQGSAFWGSQVLHLVFGAHRPEKFQILTPTCH